MASTLPPALATLAIILALAWLLARHLRRKKKLPEVKLSQLAPTPLRLQPQMAYNVVEVLDKLQEYIQTKLSSSSSGQRLQVAGLKCVPPLPQLAVLMEECHLHPEVASEPDASVSAKLILGKGVLVAGTLDLRKGPVKLGAGSVLEPGAFLAGPAIIGKDTCIRSGAYIRGNVLVGDRVVLRGEVKNAIIMDEAELCHPGYAGDSIIGYKAHFGCQALTANLGLFGSDLRVPRSSCQPVALEGVRVNLQRRKMGVILGDFSQLGCSTVTDPATFMARNTHTYPLCRISSGFYGPDEIIKNKPEEPVALQRQSMENQKRDQIFAWCWKECKVQTGQVRQPLSNLIRPPHLQGTSPFGFHWFLVSPPISRGTTSILSCGSLQMASGSLEASSCGSSSARRAWTSKRSGLSRRPFRGVQSGSKYLVHFKRTLVKRGKGGGIQETGGKRKGLDRGYKRATRAQEPSKPVSKSV
ncbi:unnamed protein product [Effrenium voratum]|nr:unnamed protein product [Effrenium voratum]